MNTISNIGWRLMLSTFPQLVGLGHSDKCSYSPEMFQKKIIQRYGVAVDDVFFPDQLDLKFPLFKEANNKKEKTTEIKLGKPRRQKGWDGCETLGDLMVSSFLYLFYRFTSVYVGCACFNKNKAYIRLFFINQAIPSGCNF